MSHSCYLRTRTHTRTRSVQVLFPLLSPARCQAQDLQAPGRLQVKDWWQDDMSAEAHSRWAGSHKAKEDPQPRTPYSIPWLLSTEGSRWRARAAEKLLWKGLFSKSLEVFPLFRSPFGQENHVSVLLNLGSAFYNLFKTFQMQSLSALKSLVYKPTSPTCFD